MHKRLKYIVALFAIVISFSLQTFAADTLSTVTADDGFETVEGSDEFGAVGATDEFQETSSDEFSEVSTTDEFSATADTLTSEHNCNGGVCSKKKSALDWVIAILLFTILAGVLVRYEKTRSLRGVFLLASVIILGFYRSACPCPISSVQDFVLALIGQPYDWRTLVYFLALLPITYVFGKVWCGWICHLGALQELIYLPGRLSFFNSHKAQKVMLWIRKIAFVTLIVQLLVTQSNLYCKIDPFKVAYNLFSTSLTGYILLGITLLSSIFIFRPFCKTICPIGLVLGWISAIPGAALLGVNKNCKSCGICNKDCKINAIVKNKLDNQECIACGNCLEKCRHSCLSFKRNSKHHPQKIEL
ncbi:MAG: 4Fe-4S binding protein [Bacteroidales bacterium]|nr:4Fe-4S binding protein [Bacteroidales bacterium]